jgi:hypothetical protein
MNIYGKGKDELGMGGLLVLIGFAGLIITLLVLLADKDGTNTISNSEKHSIAYYAEKFWKFVALFVWGINMLAIIVGIIFILRNQVEYQGLLVFGAILLAFFVTIIWFGVYSFVLTYFEMAKNVAKIEQHLTLSQVSENRDVLK